MSDVPSVEVISGATNAKAKQVTLKKRGTNKQPQKK